MLEIICQSQLDGAEYLPDTDVSKTGHSFLQKRQLLEVAVKSLSLSRLRSLKYEGEQFWTKPGKWLYSYSFSQIYTNQ